MERKTVYELAPILHRPLAARSALEKVKKFGHATVNHVQVMAAGQGGKRGAHAVQHAQEELRAGLELVPTPLQSMVENIAREVASRLNPAITNLVQWTEIGPSGELGVPVH